MTHKAHKAHNRCRAPFDRTNRIVLADPKLNPPTLPHHRRRRAPFPVVRSSQTPAASTCPHATILASSSEQRRHHTPRHPRCMERLLCLLTRRPSSPSSPLAPAGLACPGQKAAAAASSSLALACRLQPRVRPAGPSPIAPRHTTHTRGATGGDADGFGALGGRGELLVPWDLRSP